jgi:hypothetical protein
MSVRIGIGKSGLSPPEAMTSALASLTRQLGARRLLQRGKPARAAIARRRVDQEFDVLDVEPELRDARDDHRRGGLIAAIEHDVPLGSGDEEGRDGVRADVVEIAGDAERFGGLLPFEGAFSCHFMPTNTAGAALSASSRSNRSRLVR